jgi:prevent-host-death family protein
MTMSVGIFEAKTRLSELVEQVAGGGDAVVITKRGKPVARLLPPIAETSTVENALALLLAARKASTSSPGTLRELIDEGRRR